MRPNKWLREGAKLQQDVESIETARGQQIEELKSNPVEFFRQVVGFEPTSYQKELIELFERNQFLAARWCRQSGKSWIISALLLHYALNHPDSYIAVVGPSWRQTKLNIRRINYFLRRVPTNNYLKP
jgi:hypothetical protein